MGYWSMIHKNIEGHKEFNIPKNWYKDRPKGLSAIVRCIADEERIEGCVSSLLGLFDEIVVVNTPVKNDNTKQIIDHIDNPKIKYFEYPFMLKKTRVGKEHHSGSKKPVSYKLRDVFMPPNEKRGSVHNFSYYTNWAVAISSFSHVWLWDSDEILMKEYNTKEFHDFVLQWDYFSCYGLNIVSYDLEISKDKPKHGPIPRCYRVNKFWFMPGRLDESEGTSYRMHKEEQFRNIFNYLRFPFQQLLFFVHCLKKSDYWFDKPVFYHTKLVHTKSSKHKDKANVIEYEWNWENVK